MEGDKMRKLTGIVAVVIIIVVGIVLTMFLPIVGRMPTTSLWAWWWVSIWCWVAILWPVLFIATVGYCVIQFKHPINRNKYIHANGDKR